MYLPSSWISILSLIIAALAVLFGPLIQLYIAKAQIRASVLSANRQRWIDQLRQHVAEFITVASELNTNSKLHLHDDATTLQKTREMHLCKSTIKLMLNPTKEDHQRLIQLLNDATDGITKSIDEDRTDIPAIVALTQAIQKKEWERVKATK